jgi:hypothetical protein
VPLQKNKTASFPEIFFYVTTMICQDWFWTKTSGKSAQNKRRRFFMQT